MKYIKEEISLGNPFFFWEYFKGCERMVFYHPFKKELIFSAVRLQEIGKSRSPADCPSAFCTKKFNKPKIRLMGFYGQ